LEIRQPTGISRNQFVFAYRTIEAQRTGVAGTDNFSRPAFEQMAVLRPERHAAKIALLGNDRCAWPRKTPQNIKRIAMCV
jgi:hypothetical protein